MGKRKKSVKKLIKVGSIIRTSEAYYEVIALKDRHFDCVDIKWMDTAYQGVQEFYYNIDMIVFNEAGRNVE